MNGFDDRFADRAREVFDAYAEPVDEPTWERVQASLAKAPPARDRAPIAGARTRRLRALVALATVLLVGGVGSWAVWQAATDVPDAPPLAAATDAPRSTPLIPEPAGAAADPEGAAPVPSASQGTTPPAEPPRIAAARPAPREAGGARGVAARQSAASPARGAPARSTRAAPERARSSLGADAVPLVPAEPPARAPESLSPPAAFLSDLAAAASSDAAPSDAAPSANAAAGEAAPAPFVAEATSALVEDLAPREPWAETEARSAPSADPSALGVDVVLATNAAFSGRQLAEGVGLTAGVAREWRIGGGLAISTGALAAYTRLETGGDGTSTADAFTALSNDPSRAVAVPSQTTLSTVALEVPLDVIVDLADTGPGRLRAGVGLTTSLYLAQTFEDEGARYSLDPTTGASGDPSVDVRAEAYSATETAGPLSRLDLGRQANVSLGYTLDGGRAPLSFDAYTRLPLGGVTSRDLKLTVVGLRLRVGL